MAIDANQFETAKNFAAVAANMVGLDLNLASTLYKDVAADFRAGGGNTVRIRVPGAPQSSTKGVYDVTTPLEVGSITENGIDVVLDTHAYSSVVLSEGDLDLSLEDYSTQVLAPQSRSIATYIERAAASAMQAVPAATSITYDPTNPAKAFTAARRILRSNGVDNTVPLVASVGAGEYADLLDANTTTAPVFDATGRVRGFDVQESTRLAENEAVFYVPQAFALVVRAPQVPSGAPFGASIRTDDGQFALRYLRAFDSTVAADRSIVSAFVGVTPLPLAVDNEDGTVSLVENGGVVHLTGAVA